MSNLVDFHCHLDLYPNYESLIDACEREKIYTLAVTTTPKAWPRNRDLMMQKKYVRPALGLHPQLVKKDIDAELMLWDKYFSEAKYIGEVGLDAGPRFYHTLDEQKRVFHYILKRCAATGNKILSIHSTRSPNVVLDFLEEFHITKNNKVVLHWFTGGKSEARRAVELGCYFSINAEMLTTIKRNSLLKKLPMECLLSETDGPFTQHNQKPNEPKDVSVVINLLAGLHNTTPANMKNKIVANFKTLLQSKNKDARLIN